MSAQDPLPAHATAAELLRARRHVVVHGLPGSGTTTALIEVRAALIDSGLAPADILVLTPSRAHADAIRDRLPGEVVRGGAAARSLHSFAYGLVAADTAVRTGVGTRYLSGADQDGLLAGLLDGHSAGLSPAPRWPESIPEEMRSTERFRAALRDALDRVGEIGAQPHDIAACAAESGRPEWAALAHVLQDYRDLVDVPGFGGVDTAQVLAEAAAIVRAEDADGIRASDPWSFSADRVPAVVLVDAAQDVPDAAVGLLRGLADMGAAIGVFGSVDASTQGFRGGGGGLLAAAASRARAPFGASAESIVLQPDPASIRGAGAVAALCADLGRRVSAHLELGHIPRTGLPIAGDSAVAALVHRSAAERSRDLARRIRAWHHDEGVPFSDIAVIARTAAGAQGIRAELRSLDIPVAASSLPLSADPATAPLLRLLAPDDRPSARALLAGVYGGADPLSLMGVERTLTVRLLAVGAEIGDDVIAAAVDALPEEELPAGVRTAARMVSLGAELASADPHTALWGLWEAAGVADEWRSRALDEPSSGFDERLDAVVRLFALAEKVSGQTGLTASAFAEQVLAQTVAQDSLGRHSAASLVSVDSPAALSHRDFSRVCIVDLCEGLWPNPRIRRSPFAVEELLGALTGEEPVAEEPAAALRRAREATMRDEAMLLLSAASRARDELLVCALDDGENSPSAFHSLVEEWCADRRAAADAHSDGDVAECAADAVDADSATALGAEREPDGDDALLPARIRDVVAEARREIAGDDADVSAWAELLAALAAAGASGADPRTWSTWFEASSSAPVLAPDAVARIRPSQVEAVAQCPLRWFLGDAGGQQPPSSAQSIGTLLHAIAQDHPRGEDRTAMREQLEVGLKEIAADSEWESAELRSAAERMLDRLAEYLSDTADAFVAAEAVVEADSPPSAPGAPWRIRGRIDRLETASAADGLRVIDFKTGRAEPPSPKDMGAHPQLAAYQLALACGDILLADGDARRARPGGAELVYLRKTKGTVREQAALDPGTPGDEADGAWAYDLVGQAAETMRGARFPAIVGEHCRTCPVAASCPAQSLASADAEGDR